MEENFQNQFDIGLSFKLCQEIIRERKFECLVELNQQCSFLISKIDPDRGEIRFSLEEDTLLIPLYYIYFIMLDKKERLIFSNISKLILRRNIFLYDYFISKGDEWENDFHSTEEKKIGRYIVLLLKKYVDNKDSEKEIDIEKLNQLIYFLYKNEYQRIPNTFYLIMILGIGTLDLSNVLSEFCYNAIIDKCRNVCDILCYRFFCEDCSFLEGEEDEANEDADKDILKQIDQIRF